MIILVQWDVSKLILVIKRTFFKLEKDEDDKMPNSPDPKETLTSPLTKITNQVVTGNPYTATFVPVDTFRYSTPSFNSVAHPKFPTASDLSDSQDPNQIPLTSLAFSDSTKSLINPELLSNMKSLSYLISCMESTLTQYKEYYKVDKLESQFLQLTSILQTSFTQAFTQIADLSIHPDGNSLSEENSKVSIFKGIFNFYV